MAKTTKKKKAFGVVLPKLLNVRFTPNGKITDTVKQGAVLEIASEKDGWFKVSFGNLSGWVDGKYLAIEEDK